MLVHRKAINVRILWNFQNPSHTGKKQLHHTSHRSARWINGNLTWSFSNPKWCSLSPSAGDFSLCLYYYTVLLVALGNEYFIAALGCLGYNHLLESRKSNHTSNHRHFQMLHEQRSEKSSVWSCLPAIMLCETPQNDWAMHVSRHEHIHSLAFQGSIQRGCALATKFSARIVWKSGSFGFHGLSDWHIPKRFHVFPLV